MPLNHFAARHFRARHFLTFYGLLFTQYIFNAVYHRSTQAGAVYWYAVSLLAVYVLNSPERAALFESHIAAGATWDYEKELSAIFTEEIHVHSN